MNLMNIDENVTMSSLEIAEITGKDHYNVIRDVRNMLKEINGDGGALKFEGSYLSSQNKELPCFNLPYRETMILMAGYSHAVAARIVDRWLHLERENKLLKDHMKKMVSLDEVKVYKIEAASAKAAQHRAEDNYYAIEKFMFKNMDKCGNPAELDEQYFDVKFESNRYHDSQEVVYKYQAQLEVACEKLKAKDELIANLVDNNREILKLK